MKLAILSDIHANITSLEKALKLCEEQGIDRIYSLGDVIGYFPFVNDTIRKLLACEVRSIYGNHELYYLGGLPIPEKALEYFDWYHAYLEGHLTEESRAYITGMDSSLHLESEGIRLYHGSPVRVDHYLYPERFSEGEFDLFDAPLTFIGHTHLPMQKTDGTKQIINPGSVGLNRDKSRAHDTGFFGIWDTESSSYRQIEYRYDMDEVIARLDQAGLLKHYQEHGYVPWIFG